MGTTLSNGVYLPDEGERNCYAGLKVNWEILNQKVADIVALQLAIAGALHREIVESLPTTDIDPNTIYMILSGTSATENVYNEFMYVNNAWELIGTSATDLTNYYTKAEVDGKLLLKANASDLTSHTGDTTIHVTASDKTKWTNSANTHVLRLALSALTPSTSDNSFSNLDDSTALKVGDKVMDTAGVLFEVTAVDTANSTFTIGTALIDLAQDSDVVHKSGDETVGGTKTFTAPNINLKSNVAEYGVTGGNTQFYLMDKNGVGLSKINQGVYASGVSYIALQLYGKDSNNQTVTNAITYQYTSSFNNTIILPTDTKVDLGTIGNRWGKIYGIQYYYGSNNVEFSTKFVTTDTDQTISGNKTWSGLNTFQQNITYQRTNFYHQAVSPCYILKDTELEKGSLASTHTAYPGLWQDKNNNVLGYVRFVEYSSGRQTAEIRVSNLIKNGTLDPTGTEDHCTVNLELQPSGEKSLIPERNNDINLGTSTNKWKTFNGVEPSSLSLPSGNASDFIDISSYFANTGSGDTNTYTAPANGWVYLFVTACKTLTAYIQTASDTLYADYRERTTDGQIRMMLPIQRNNKFTSHWTTSSTVSITKAVFIPCQGNV